MTYAAAARERLSAARVVLLALETLPDGAAEGLWRHAVICHHEQVTCCVQGNRMIERHLVGVLRVRGDWQAGWNPAEALRAAVLVGQLPTLFDSAPADR